MFQLNMFYTNLVPCKILLALVILLYSVFLFVAHTKKLNKLYF